MTTAEFLSYLHSQNVKLWVEGEQLRCKAAKNVLTSDLQAELKNRRAEILAFLKLVNGNTSSKELAIQCIPREGHFPLSFAQQRLWFLDQFEPGSTAYLLTQALRLRGPLNRSALEQSLNSLVARHESLRTTFAEVEGHQVQVIAPSLILPLPVVDLQDLSDEEQETAIRQRVQEEASTPLALAVGPLIRTTLL
jgi:hypothetical protein